MAIVGHGVDLVEVSRIAQMVGEHGERFLERCFTAHERESAAPDNRRRFEHLAARFAAKEAAMKALGTGLADGISWTELEVFRLASGAPTLRVTGRAAEIASARGIVRWHVSLSHTESMAIASVIAERD